MTNSKLPQYTLSKSDFKVARTCATKLYYKELKYPTTHDTNEYMQLLAQGGYMVGLMAQLYYPEGFEVKTQSGTRYAIDETKELLKQNEVTLFEPAIYSDHKLIRIDILIKNGNHFDLIEVKSKSHNSEKYSDLFNTKNEIERDYKTYVEDVAYQTLVLKEAYPDHTVTPYLMMPDKAMTTDIKDLISWFSIKESANSTPSFTNYDVSFNGDVKALRQDKLLTLVDVTKEVQHVMEYVKNSTERYLESLKKGLKKIEEPLTTKCKGCEFISSDITQSGFHQCFGKLAEHEHHVFKLYKMGRLRDKSVNKMLKQEKVSMFDVPEDILKLKSGEWGTDGTRRKIQLDCTKNNQEWIDPTLKKIMSRWQYPLHFIDFEGSTMAIPYHKGLSPYENVAFQWSCHTIQSPGATPQHTEWINTEDTLPNFRFAESLMAHLKFKGTVFMWSPYENTVLSKVFAQMQDHNHDNPDLVNWLSLMVKFKDDESYTMVDLCKLAGQHYYHPDMQGSASIKAVLPAIWNNTPALWQIPWLKKYVKIEDGKAIDPYKTLAGFESKGTSGSVKGGTDAILAYQEMMYGAYRDDPTIKNHWRDLLLRYCELDTMAMVIIWKYWMDKFNLDI